MAGEKSLKDIIRGFRNIIGTDEFKGLNNSIKKQMGGRVILKGAGKALLKNGLLRNLGKLKNFKVGEFTANLFIEQWKLLGDREAIVDGDKRITYRQMCEEVLSLGAALQDLGVRPRDRVGVMLYNSAEYFEAFLAASIIGCPLPAVNYHLRGSEICETVNLRKPKVLIFDHEFLDDIQSYRERFTSVEHYVMVGGEAPPGIESFDKLITSHRGREPEVNFIFALNPYTGGTTGTPKSSNLYDGLSYLMSDLAESPRGTMEEYIKYLVCQFSFFEHYGGQQIEDPETGNIRTLITTPMYHAGTAAGYSPFMLLGATAVPLRKFDPEKFLATVEKERISWSFAVPTILQRILEMPDEVKRRYDLSSMHTLISAAAPCPVEVKKAINELFMAQGAKGPVFHEYYGSSETGLITLLIPEDYREKPERIKSVGKMRCGDIMIYDPESEKEAEPGRNGLVMSRTVATMSLRYPGMEAKLSESIRVINGTEWYDDGLVGYLDEDGFLYLTSRVKEMIISGGVNVYPREMEDVILTHPKVSDVAVIRAPHPDLVEMPLACVKLKDGEECTEEEIIHHCKDKGLHGYNLPQKVDFYEKLPRKIDGKLIKRELEEKYWEGVEHSG